MPKGKKKVIKPICCVEAPFFHNFLRSSSGMAASLSQVFWFFRLHFIFLSTKLRMILQCVYLKGKNVCFNY